MRAGLVGDGEVQLVDKSIDFFNVLGHLDHVRSLIFSTPSCDK